MAKTSPKAAAPKESGKEGKGKGMKEKGQIEIAKDEERYAESKKTDRELRHIAFDLIEELRKGRWRNGSNVKEIQREESFHDGAIEDIVRLSRGEGCKRGSIRLRYKWEF